MLDDADYHDVGYNVATLDRADAITPVIDTLRANGKAFTQFYSGSAICTPTRISVLSGGSPLRFGAFDAWPQLAEVRQGSLGTSGIPDSIPQLGRLMQERGLRTAHHGKWHVGVSRPEHGHRALGFDDFSYHTSEGRSDRGTWHGTFQLRTEEGAEVIDLDYLDRYFADQVIESIIEADDAGERFYINFWPLTPHFPWSPPRDFDNDETGFDLDSERGRLLAMMHGIDAEIGRIVSVLEQRALLDDTLIVITSDNGGARPVRHPDSPLAGSKGTLLEGGIRVPMVAHWPAGIEAGSVNDSFMTTSDLLTTFVDLLGGDPSGLYDEPTVDGRSKRDALVSDASVSHEPVVWQISGGPARTADTRARRSYALRVGDWKLTKHRRRNDLTRANAYTLHNLAVDPGESVDLSAEEPERLRAMRRQLHLSRLEISRFDRLPTSARRRTVIAHDPRFDVGSKDMTLVFELRMPDELPGEPLNLFSRSGAHSLTLEPDGSIRWRIRGAGRRGDEAVTTLSTPPLEGAAHRVVAAIAGHKDDVSEFRLDVDGRTVVASPSDDDDAGIRAVWSNDSDVVLGDTGVILSDVAYHLVYFHADELAEDAFQARSTKPIRR